MDTKQLIKDAKARFNHNAAKAQLKDKYQSKLVVADQGGLWTITPSFLSLLSSSDASSLILLDSYDNPIKVDRLSLLIKANGLYVQVMQDWYDEFTELQRNR